VIFMAGTENVLPRADGLTQKISEAKDNFVDGVTGLAYKGVAAASRAGADLLGVNPVGDRPLTGNDSAFARLAQDQVNKFQRRFNASQGLNLSKGSVSESERIRLQQDYESEIG
jgi:hypothetical protein